MGKPWLEISAVRIIRFLTVFPHMTRHFALTWPTCGECCDCFIVEGQEAQAWTKQISRHRYGTATCRLALACFIATCQYSRPESCV